MGEKAPKKDVGTVLRGSAPSLKAEGRPLTHLLPDCGGGPGGQGHGGGCWNHLGGSGSGLSLGQVGETGIPLLSSLS